MKPQSSDRTINLTRSVLSLAAYAIAMVFAVVVAQPVAAQDVTFYLSESTFNAALPASRTTVVEDFASVTADFDAAVQPATPDQWNGFTVVATNTPTTDGPVRYCASLAGAGCVTRNSTAPSVPGLVARTQANSSPNVSTIITPDAGTFAFGFDEVELNNVNNYIAMDVLLSNSTTVTYVRPFRPTNSPPGFVGMKVSDSLIASGVTITSITFRGQFFTRSFGIFKAQTISAGELNW